MTESQAERRFGRLTISEFRDLILRRDEESELATFYLLRHKMLDKLVSIYNTVEVHDELDDILMDFYLYLRDGKGNHSQRLFQTLEGLRSWISFEGFVLRIFKNFLLDRLNKEQRDAEAQKESKGMGRSEYSKEKDQRIRNLGAVISFVDQTNPSRERFIFFRSLLMTLDKSIMIPNEQIAACMDLTYGNYRQIDSRLRQEARFRLKDLSEGRYPSLNLAHAILAGQIERDFESLSSIIKDLYEKALAELSCKDKINELRKPKKEGSEEGARYSLKSRDSVRYSITDNNDREMSEGLKYSRLFDDSDFGGYIPKTPTKVRPQFIPASSPVPPITYSPEVKIDFFDICTRGKQWKTVCNFLGDELPQK